MEKKKPQKQEKKEFTKKNILEDNSKTFLIFKIFS